MKHYFAKNDEISYPLSYHIEQAKEDGLTEITLFEAVPDKDNNKDFVLCWSVLAVGDKSECNKSCEFFVRTSGRFCDFRGRLSMYGNQVTIKVK